jgi:hypothetical protein
MASYWSAVGDTCQPSSYFDQYPTPGQPPRPARGGLELGEIQLPHLVRRGRLDRERRLPPGGELAAFPLVVRLQQQPFLAQQPQHAGRGHR